MAEARANLPGLPAFGGYDDQFVDAVDDDFLCVICQLPLKEPILTKCGHRFCTQCLNGHFERLERDGQPLNCPVDRDKLSRETADIFADKATERKILSFVIKCPSKGCLWSGELRSKDSHLASCFFRVVSCTNNNCNVRLPRSGLQYHVAFRCDWRVLHCWYCGVSHAVCNTVAHQSECKRLPRGCPNKCRDVIPREEISIHIVNDCPLTKIPCPYAEMGCTVKVQRRKVKFHVEKSTNFHLDLACAKLNETRIQLRDTQEKVNALESRSGLLQISGVHTWKICGFKEMMKQAFSGKQTVINSPPFYDHGYKFGLTFLPIQTSLFYVPTYIFATFFLMKGEYDPILSWPLRIKKVTITLIDQQENPRQRANVVKSFTSHDALYTLCLTRVENGRDTIPAPFTLVTHDDIMKRRYVVDDTIFIQVHIEQ